MSTIPRMRFPRFLLRLALALLLVLGQQAATLHELSHRFEDLQARHDTGAPHSDVCEKCLAFAGFTSTLASAILTVAPQTLAPVMTRTRVDAGRSAVFAAAYQSRAPPLLS